MKQHRTEYRQDRTGCGSQKDHSLKIILPEKVKGVQFSQNTNSNRPT